MNSLTIQKEAARAVAAARYSAMAMFSLHVCEWFLWLQEEVVLIHQARWTSWAWVPGHDAITCARVSRPVYVAVLPCPLSTQAVILIRAHAFTGRKKIVLVTLLLGFLAVAAAHIWLFSPRFEVAFPESELAILGNNGCFQADVEVVALINTAMQARRGGLVLLGSFLLDLLALILVITHCLKIRSTQGSLGRTFLKQGVNAFLVISLVTLVGSALCFRSNGRYNVTFPFIWIGSPLVACRLILQLRQKRFPTESQQIRMHSRLVREAFDGLEELDHKPEREQWISTWNAELDPS